MHRWASPARKHSGMDAENPQVSGESHVVSGDDGRLPELQQAGIMRNQQKGASALRVQGVKMSSR